MSKQNGVFSRHSDEQQKDYEREARLHYGPDNVNESIRRWNSYSDAKQETILAEGHRIYMDMAGAMEAGTPPDSDEVRGILDRWQANLRHFYEPTLEVLRGLGDLYNSDERFIANFQKLHPDLPAYLQEAIAVYVDDLETAELERMLAEDEAMQRRLSRLGG